MLNTHAAIILRSCISCLEYTKATLYDVLRLCYKNVTFKLKIFLNFFCLVKQAYSKIKCSIKMRFKLRAITILNCIIEINQVFCFDWLI